MDNVPIAYSAAGSGPPLVFVSSPPYSLILDQERKASWWDALMKQRQVIRYDVRGTGASQGAGATLTVDSAVRDLAAVADALSLETFSLMTINDGAAIGLAYAAECPQRVDSLMVFNGWSHGADCVDDASGPMERAMRGNDHRLYTELLAQVSMNFQGGQRGRTLAELMRASSTPETLRSVLAAMDGWDVRPLLASVRCPVLVIQNEQGFPARGAGERLASLLPAGRFTHLAGTERPPVEEVVSFFDEFRTIAPAEPQTTLSRREVEVLRLLAEGYANKQIAFQLGISLNTVLRHVSNVFDKTGAHNRVEAASAARRLGLVL